MWHEAWLNIFIFSTLSCYSPEELQFVISSSCLNFDRVFGQSLGKYLPKIMQVAINLLLFFQHLPGVLYLGSVVLHGCLDHNKPPSGYVFLQAP